MEKILVTGANGYIGSHVVSTLIDMGYEVVAVDFKNNWIDKRATFLSADIFSGDDSLYEQLGSPERLIHLAWKDGFVHNASSHLEYLPLHYEFIKNMVDHGVKSVSVMGSMHEVGYHEGAIFADTPTNPTSLYGISKNALRQALMLLSSNSNFSLHWIRGYYICGDDKRNNSIFAKILQKANDGEKVFPFTTGLNKYDFISVDDLALEISLCATQDDVNGVVNCCSGKPLALKTAVENFIKENNLDIKLQYGVFPTRPYDSPIIYGDVTEIKQIVSNAKTDKADILDRISKLKTTLN